MLDSRLTNAITDLLGDISDISRTAHHIDGLLDDLKKPTPERGTVARGHGRLAVALAELAGAVGEFQSVADCGHPGGFAAWCHRPYGHQGLHGAYGVEWDDQSAQRSRDAAAKAMGGRTE